MVKHASHCNERCNSTATYTVYIDCKYLAHTFSGYQLSMFRCNYCEFRGLCRVWRIARPSTHEWCDVNLDRWSDSWQ